MLLSDALEVAIGLSLIFTMLSLVLTSVNELIESVLKSRGAKLRDGIEELLAPVIGGQDRGRAAALAIYAHPGVQGLMRGTAAAPNAKRRLPSYIPTRQFALALIGQALDGKFEADAGATRLPTAASPTERLRFAAERITNAQLRGLLLQAVAVAGSDMDAVAAHLGQVFDGAMDRVSGWYKRRTQRIIFVIGLLVAVMLNVNTLTLADSLSESATLRRTVVAQAEAVTHQGLPALTASQANDQITATGLPVGWSGSALTALERPLPGKDGARVFLGRAAVLGLIQILCGWLLTAFAVSLGAPFWFDVLNRLMVIRATVKPTEKSKDEAPQDPQPQAARTGAVIVMPPATDPPPVARNDLIDADVFKDGADLNDRRWALDEGGVEPAIAPDTLAPVSQEGQP